MRAIKHRIPICFLAVIVVLLTPALLMAADGTVEGEVSVRVLGLNCQGCIDKAVKALKGVEGVEDASVDLKTTAGRISLDQPVEREVLRGALAAVDLELLFEGEKPTPRLTEEELAKLDIDTVSVGKKIDLEEHLARNKYTVFYFTADWCAPCKILKPKLERMVHERPEERALRVIDMVDWKSDMARHATKEFGVKALPYMRVYGPDGKFRGEATGYQPDAVAELIGGAQ